MSRAKQRTSQLREHIVQVAVAVLAADGVGAFTTRKLAEQAQTSPPAVYELSGDKAGLVREVFVEGFRLLGDCFGRLRESDDPRAYALPPIRRNCSIWPIFDAEVPRRRRQSQRTGPGCGRMRAAVHLDPARANARR